MTEQTLLEKKPITGVNLKSFWWVIVTVVLCTVFVLKTYSGIIDKIKDLSTQQAKDKTELLQQNSSDKEIREYRLKAIELKQGELESRLENLRQQVEINANTLRKYK